MPIYVSIFPTPLAEIPDHKQSKLLAAQVQHWLEANPEVNKELNIDNIIFRTHYINPEWKHVATSLTESFWVNHESLEDNIASKSKKYAER